MTTCTPPLAAPEIDQNFKATFRLGEDLRSKYGQDHCPEIRSAEEIASAFQDMSQLSREIMIAGTVDCKCRLTYWNIVSVGCSNKVAVRIGEIFHGAVLTHGTGVFLVHNHPSGSLKPSNLDLQLTRQVAGAGELLGYPLLDHVIIATKGHRSIMKLSMPRAGRQVPRASQNADRMAADAAENPGGFCDF